MKYLRLDQRFALQPDFLIHFSGNYYLLIQHYILISIIAYLKKFPFETARPSTFSTVLKVNIFTPRRSSQAAGIAFTL
jgi:hypothetical protein